MSKGCSGENSPDYVFSTPGFDPCHSFDLENGQTEIKYFLNCKAIDKDGYVIPDGHSEGLGYEYADLVEQPTGEPFPYIENQRGVKIMEGLQITFSMEFRNWKYMSESMKFQHTTSDPMVITGEKEGTQPIDFSSFPSGPDDQYIVGGRVFWEASIFANGFISFTTNGFFEKEGY